MWGPLKNILKIQVPSTLKFYLSHFTEHGARLPPPSFINNLPTSRMLSPLHIESNFQFRLWGKLLVQNKTHSAKCEFWHASSWTVMFSGRWSLFLKRRWGARLGSCPCWAAKGNRGSDTSAAAVPAWQVPGAALWGLYQSHGFLGPPPPWWKKEASRKRQDLMLPWTWSLYRKQNGSTENPVPRTEDWHVWDSSRTSFPVPRVLTF